MMQIYSLYILNKAGGLIYQSDINPGVNKLTVNDYLVLAGTLHGTHAIASNLTPNLHQGVAITPSGTTSSNSGAASTASAAAVAAAAASAASTAALVPAPASNSALIATGKWQNPNTNKTGLQSIETDNFNLYIFQSLTGIKFVIITSPNTIVHNVQTSAVLLDIEDQLRSYNRGELVKQCQRANEIFRNVYVAYSDFVMKNPFYAIDMPIKCALFDKKVLEYTKVIN